MARRRRPNPSGPGSLSQRSDLAPQPDTVSTAGMQDAPAARHGERAQRAEVEQALRGAAGGGARGAASSPTPQPPSAGQPADPMAQLTGEDIFAPAPGPGDPTTRDRPRSRPSPGNVFTPSTDVFLEEAFRLTGDPDLLNILQLRKGRQAELIDDPDESLKQHLGPEPQDGVPWLDMAGEDDMALMRFEDGEEEMDIEAEFDLHSPTQHSRFNADSIANSLADTLPDAQADSPSADPLAGLPSNPDDAAE